MIIMTHVFEQLYRVAFQITHQFCTGFSETHLYALRTVEHFHNNTTTVTSLHER